jgi:methylmalonyl-CoA/ethylmalonyl-CoA epimerase
MNPTLGQVAQYAADLDRAETFYRDILGLPFTARFDPPGLVFFDLGGIRLLLEKGAPPALIYLKVADVDAETERLRGLGVEITEEPHLIFADEEGLFGPPGYEVRMAGFKDSEGNQLCLTT